MQESYENKMELKILSKSSNESFARVAVAAFASQLDLNIEDIADIKTAVSEAVTNCIIHAYDTSEGIITIEAKLTNNSLEIEDELKVESIVGLGTKVSMKKIFI